MNPIQKITRILSSYQPRPGPAFYQRMAQAPWNIKEPQMTHSTQRPSRLGWQLAAGIIVVLTLLTLGIPSVRASLSAWMGLSVAPSNQMPASAMTLVAVTPVPSTTATSTPSAVPANATTIPTETRLPPTQTPAGTSVPVEISQLSPQAGWTILAPGRLPKGYKFESAYLDTNHTMVILTYLATRPLPGATDPSLTETKSITFLQALKNDFVPMQVAPATHVEDTQVNGLPGVYVLGAWKTEFVKDDKDPSGGKMVSTWQNDLPVQNLYWQAGKLYLLLVTDDGAVSKPDLLDMAASVPGK